VLKTCGSNVSAKSIYGSFSEKLCDFFMQQLHMYKKIQIKGTTNGRKQQVLVRKFVTEYIDILKQYHEKDVTDPKVVFDSFMETKVVRDVFLDFLDSVMELDIDIGNLLCEIFETLYNTLIYAKTYSSNGSSYNDYEFDVYKCHIWELFICIEWEFYIN
jgi:hypothetical protein